MASASLTFYGAFGENQRVTVVPAELRLCQFTLHSGRDAAMRERCAQLPTLLQRTWLWSALSIQSNRTCDIVEFMLRWDECSDGRDQLRARPASLKSAKEFHWVPSKFSVDEVAKLYRRIAGTEDSAFREAPIRFGRT